MRRCPRFQLALMCLFVLTGCRPAEEEVPISSSGWAVHTVCGSGSTVPGIDVSKWQATVNWTSVKASGQVFAIVRVSDGLTYPDSYFATNWRETRRVGLIRGVYQYFRPAQDAVKQADYLVDEVGKAGGFQAGDLPPVNDLETNDGLSASAVQAALDKWVARIEQRTGMRPIIYTGSYFWDGKVLTTKYSVYPLWTAHYTTASCPLVPNAWSRWSIWQYSSSGRVPGVSGNTDVNRFNGTLVELQALAAGSVLRRDGGVPDQPRPTPDRGRPDQPRPSPDRAPRLDQPRPAPDRAKPTADVRTAPDLRRRADTRPAQRKDAAPVPASMSSLDGGCSLTGAPGPLWPLLPALLHLRRRRRPRR